VVLIIIIPLGKTISLLSLKNQKGLLMMQSILINKSGLIYKFIKKRDFKKEAFKKEQKFLTV